VTAERRFDAALVAALGALTCAVALLDPGRYVDFHKAYDAVAREILRTGSFEYTYPSLKNLPIVAALFLPFAVFERDTSDLLFLGFEIACYVAAFALALAHLAEGRRQKLALFALFATSRPFYICIELGQLSVACFLLLVACLVALRRRRDLAAGAFASLAFVLKIPAGLLLPWLLLRGRVRAAGAAVLAFCAVLAASFAVFGASLHADYFEMVIRKNAGQTLTAGNNASLAASWMRLARARERGDGDDLRRWRMIPLTPHARAGVALFGAGLLAALALALARREPGGDEALLLEFSLVICASLLVLPVVWDHYFLFLLIPLFATGRRAAGPASGAWWLAAFALAELPVPALADALAGAPRWRALRAAVPAAPWLASLALLGLALRQRAALTGLRARPRPAARPDGRPPR
jgi:hypothetical protein